MRFTPLARWSTIAAALAAAGCTTPHPGSFARAYADPWESTNRKLYAFNKQADRFVLRPVAVGYRTVVPTAARRGLGNVFNNIQEPLSFVNAVLQGKPGQALRIFERFAINTTIGVGGLADHATDLGRPEEKEDFGQTFAWWGIPSGPYVMLPVFGPRTLTDTGGLAADFVADPFDVARTAVVHIGIGGTVLFYGAKATVTRASLLDAGADGFLADSLDEYATLRSAYLQRRWGQIWDGNPPDEPDVLDDVPAAAPQPVKSPAMPR